jgi:hypothetical protein
MEPRPSERTDIPADLTAAIQEFVDAGRKYREFLKRNHPDRLFGVVWARMEGGEAVLYSESAGYSEVVLNAAAGVDSSPPNVVTPGTNGTAGTEHKQFVAMLERSGVGHGLRYDWDPDSVAVMVESDNEGYGDGFTVTEFQFAPDGQLTGATSYPGEVG